jgi:hypothetical protein
VGAPAWSAGSTSAAAGGGCLRARSGFSRPAQHHHTPRLRARLPPLSRCSVQGGDYAEHKVILGTHTSGKEANHLCIATVRLPTEDAEIDARKYDEEKGGACRGLRVVGGALYGGGVPCGCRRVRA